LIPLLDGAASDDEEANAEAEVAAREDGTAAVGSRGGTSVSFMMKAILWRSDVTDDGEGTGAAGTPVRNRCQTSTHSLRTLEILTMTFGARDHDESLPHIVKEVFIYGRSRAFAEWYTQGRHGFELRWERG